MKTIFQTAGVSAVLLLSCAAAARADVVALDGAVVIDNGRSYLHSNDTSGSSIGTRGTTITQVPSATTRIAPTYIAPTYAAPAPSVVSPATSTAVSVGGAAANIVGPRSLNDGDIVFYPGYGGNNSYGGGDAYIVRNGRFERADDGQYTLGNGSAVSVQNGKVNGQVGSVQIINH